MLPYLLNFGILPFAHLINRLAKASLNFSIPNHMLFQKFPDYTFLKTFGCACFPLLRPYNNHKLDFRSTECLFLGYSTSHKGYKCMSSSSRITSLRISFSMNPSFPMLTCLRLPHNSTSTPIKSHMANSSNTSTHPNQPHNQIT